MTKKASKSRWEKAQAYEKQFWHKQADKLVEQGDNHFKWYEERARQISRRAQPFLKGFSSIKALEIGPGPIGLINYLKLDHRFALDPLEDYNRSQLGLRERTTLFPEMVWRKRMAFWWEGLFFADNFVRSAARGDRVAEQLYLGWALFCIMRLAFMLNRRYAPYRKWLHRAFLELPRLSSEIEPLLAAMIQGESVEAKRDAFRRALDVLGRATNELGFIEPQPLEGESAYDEYGSGFNCYGFASAIQASITGPLSKLAYHDGAPDQWAFDLGTAKPAQYPTIARALFGHQAGSGGEAQE